MLDRCKERPLPRDPTPHPPMAGPEKCINACRLTWGLRLSHPVHTYHRAQPSVCSDVMKELKIFEKDKGVRESYVTPPCFP